MHRLALVIFAVALPILTAPGLASADSDLEASLRLEADTMDGLIRSIDAVLVDATGDQVSADSVKAHRAAKTQYKQARKLCRARKYEACYQKLRAAKKSVMPAAVEVLALGVSADVRKVIAIEVETAARRVAATAALLKDHSTDEATAAYDAAAALYREGKTLYEQGSYREAFAKLEPALDQLDIAIRAVWTHRGT